jgi:hypothetical protein
MNTCNHHVCNPTCYKSGHRCFKNHCTRYGFPQNLVNKTHFDNDNTELLHIKRIDKWLNNANPWILSTSKCNHDLKFIAAFGKDIKTLIHYIVDYIIKTSIYTTHMYFLLQIAIKSTKTIHKNMDSYNLIDKSGQLII